MPLIIPLKASPRYDLKAPLTEWLDAPSSFNAVSPMDYVCVKPNFHSVDCQKELKRLAGLRNCLSDAITKSESHKHAVSDFALQDCHEYHAALLAFEKRGFPTRDEGSPLQLLWKAAIPPQQEKHGTLVWDRACTLWNIAALSSYLASLEGSDKEGRKQAVKHYQSASACMRYIQEAIKGHSFETVDMNSSLLQFWEKAMLAQAQIAAYQMVATTPPPGNKPALLSYLAMGAVPVLNEALTHAKDPLVISSLPKPIQEWAGECKAQSMIMTARAEFHHAAKCREERDWGTEIARLSKAETCFKECIDFIKSNVQIMDAKVAEGYLRLVQERKAQALKDNILYGSEIPKVLDDIPAKLLAKNDMDMPETMTKPKVPLFDKL